MMLCVPAPHDCKRSGLRGWPLLKVPREMDEQFESLDRDAALRPTIINPGETWQLKAREPIFLSLLGVPILERCKGHTHKGHREKVLNIMNFRVFSGYFRGVSGFFSKNRTHHHITKSASRTKRFINPIFLLNSEVFPWKR